MSRRETSMKWLYLLDLIVRLIEAIRDVLGLIL
jgi:hypothetical protein